MKVTMTFTLNEEWEDYKNYDPEFLVIDMFREVASGIESVTVDKIDWED